MENEYTQLAQRITVLEVEFEHIQTSLSGITTKLDELLTLKDKGVGAVSLVGLILGSGIIGAVMLVWNFFRGG
jgi:hypothetical protein